MTKNNLKNHALLLGARSCRIMKVISFKNMFLLTMCYTYCGTLSVEGVESGKYLHGRTVNNRGLTAPLECFRGHQHNTPYSGLRMKMRHICSQLFVLLCH